MSEQRAEAKKYESVDIGDGKKRVSILVPEADRPPAWPFLGAENLIRACQAAWVSRLSFRLEGSPGGGKNALLYALSRDTHKPLYILQGHGDMEPQDLVCTPRLTVAPDGRYVASPLVAAMLCGGICFLDEIGKLPERALSVLASVLDDRRVITSVLAGFSLHAHPSFRFCAAMNPADPPLPDYIETRLRPRFTVNYPSASTLCRIISSRCNETQSVLLEAFGEWVADKELIAPRDAISIIEFAQGLATVDGRQQTTPQAAAALIKEAAEHVLVKG